MRVVFWLVWWLEWVFVVIIPVIVIDLNVVIPIVVLGIVEVIAAIIAEVPAVQLTSSFLELLLNVVDERVVDASRPGLVFLVFFDCDHLSVTQFKVGFWWFFVCEYDDVVLSVVGIRCESFWAGVPSELIEH